MALGTAAAEDTVNASVHLVCSERLLVPRVRSVLAVAGLELNTHVPGVEDLTLDERDGPHVVILAIEASPSRRTSAIRSLLARASPRVIVCQRTGLADVRRSLMAGADGYVLENQLDRTLVPAIKAVLAGLLVVPNEDRRQIGPPTLSTREKQVMAMVVMGYTNFQIAGQLHVAESTVKSHLSSIFTKLGVSSRNEAVELILDASQGLGRGVLAITTDAPELGDPAIGAARTRSATREA